MSLPIASPQVPVPVASDAGFSDSSAFDYGTDNELEVDNFIYNQMYMKSNIYPSVGLMSSVKISKQCLGT